MTLTRTGSSTLAKCPLLSLTLTIFPISIEIVLSRGRLCGSIPSLGRLCRWEPVWSTLDTTHSSQALKAWATWVSDLFSLEQLRHFLSSCLVDVLGGCEVRWSYFFLCIWNVHVVLFSEVHLWWYKSYDTGVLHVHPDPFYVTSCNFTFSKYYKTLCQGGHMWLHWNMLEVGDSSTFVVSRLWRKWGLDVHMNMS